MVNVAFQIEKHATNLPTNCKFSFQRIFGVFMKLFLNDLKTHMVKLQLCFDKCQEFGISFNLEKCMFMVFSGVILSYIVFKEGKLLDPKNIVTIVNMLELKTPKNIQVFNNMAQFYCCFI
jgi:hypothetical protein